MERVEELIPELTDAELHRTKVIINAELERRTAVRDAALPEFPLLSAFKGGAPVQVSREKAIELLHAGTHKLA